MGDFSWSCGEVVVGREAQGQRLYDSLRALRMCMAQQGSAQDSSKCSCCKFLGMHLRQSAFCVELRYITTGTN